MRAPFPYFGGKSKIAPLVWERFGSPKHYIEPFCGSAAMLLAAPKPAPLEVISDTNYFIANFWRALSHQPEAVEKWADYPVSHVDLSARHRWLIWRREVIETGLSDAEWPGDAQAAGWWLWGQCAWIGSGWCAGGQSEQIPHISDAGRGIQALGQVPHIGNPGMGIQAIGQIPHIGNTGSGMQRSTGGNLTSVSERLKRVRALHGSWDRCLNHHYGDISTAVFFDPPYRGYADMYLENHAVDYAQLASWCQEHQDRRIALCGHAGDYDLSGWDIVAWSRGKHTYGGSQTTDDERIWFSPGCLTPQPTLWEDV